MRWADVGSTRLVWISWACWARHLVESEVYLKADLDNGKTVVISEHRHPNLKAYADSKGLLVNIMRPKFGGTIYGNKANMEDMKGKSTVERNKERDRVCDEFERVQSKEYTEDQIAALKGKVLMCRCKPARCHGDTLVRLANEVWAKPVCKEGGETLIHLRSVHGTKNHIKGGTNEKN